MLQLAETQIHHYRLQRLLGQGGMSEVYLASDELLHREVALKLIERNQPEYLERFQREVTLIGSLKHDHVLPIFAYGECASWYYLVMPYLKDGTLYERLKIRGALTQQEAGLFLEQIAGALHCAHEQGILHRDVKSSNILLRNDSYAYLADFGLAKERVGSTDITQTGCIMGTLEYLAPELQEPFAIATPGSDLYALGILLYEMLTGQVPFCGDTIEAVCWQHSHQSAAPPSLLRPILSPAVDQVVLRALEKDPRQRFQTPQELAQAYQRAIGPVSHSQAAVRVTLSPQQSPNAPYSTKLPTLLPRFPSRLRIGLTLVLLLLLLSSGVAVLNSSGRAILVARQSPIPTHTFTPTAHHNSTSTPITTTALPSRHAFASTVPPNSATAPTTSPNSATTPTTTVAPTPTATSTPASIPAWQPGISYNVGEEVTYNGVTYICILAHVSQPGREPLKVPTLWNVVF